MTIDVVTAEIIRNALDTVSHEMGITIYRTARSPIANESRDFATAVFDQYARMVTQPHGAPMLMGSCKWSVHSILEDFQNDLHPEDILINNDPYRGGSHLPDFTVCMPIFHEGEHVLFTACRVHQADAGGGGGRPGGFNPLAREIWEESLRWPPLRIAEQGKLKEDLFEWLIANNRYPEWFRGDLLAMIASCKVGARSIQELISRYSVGAIHATCEHTLNYSERRFRQEIESWPDGLYSGGSVVDGDGHYTFDVEVNADVTVKGSELIVDFSRSSPQTVGFLNSTLPTTWSWVFIALGSMVDESIPMNEGILRPVTIIAPKGTLVNPFEPAPTGYSTITPGAEIAEAVTIALSKAIPTLVGSTWDKKPKYSISGIDPRTGSPYISLNFVAHFSGDGATHGRDGWGGLPASKGDMTYTTVEAYETQYPHLIEEHEYVQDTCGAGQWRGGCGVKTVERIVDHEAFVTVIAWGANHPSVGLCGGKPSSLNRVILRYGEPEALSVEGGRAVEVKLPPNSLLCARRGGGGGWGDPLARDPEWVLKDVVDGYISLDYALNEHGVVMDQAVMRVNEEATRERRKCLRDSLPKGTGMGAKEEALR